MQASPGERSWARSGEGKTAYLADMVPEDGLVVCSPQLPLEPGLWLSVVGDLWCRGSILDLREVRHGISHRDGSEGTRAHPATEVLY